MKQKDLHSPVKQISHLTSKGYQFEEEIAIANENCLPVSLEMM